MTHLTNMQRDTFWSRDLGQTGTSYSSTTLAGSLTYNSDGVVYQDAGFVFNRTLDGTITSANKGAIGIHFQAPVTEVVPYRVKAYLASAPTITGVFVARNDGTITGTNDGVNHWKAYPCRNVFDEIIQVEPAANDNALVFGIYVSGASTEDITGIISVQRLSTATPRFGSLVA